MKTYRVIVCGTGGVGGGVLREALRKPWIDVVGVLVYSEHKNGVDVGELVGMPPTGVQATTSVEDVLALEADCVLYCAMDIGDDSPDEPLIRFLESGKSVITSLAYMRPESRLGGETLRQRLDDACRKGGVAFHASGINPGYISERLVLLATGLCSDIRQIKVEEFFNCEHLHASLLGLFGIGQPEEEAKQLTTALTISNIYLTQAIEYACEQLGVTVERIEQEQFFTQAPQDVTTHDMAIKQGTVGATKYRWTAYVDGKPFYVNENTWFMSKVMQPIEAETTENWQITIEARPSIRLFLEAAASMETPSNSFDGDPTPPGYYATAIPLVQMIPVVCDAEPGFIPPPLCVRRW